MGRKGLLGHLCPRLLSNVNYSPLKDEYAQKLIFLHGLKLWVWKIVYQKIDIPDTCQGFMKMVECMEEEASICPKGETNSKVTQKNQVSLNSENKGHNKCKWGQRKCKSPSDKKKLIGKEPFVKKLKWDLSKVSNSLKLNYKINNKILGCFLDLRTTNSFIIL